MGKKSAARKTRNVELGETSQPKTFENHEVEERYNDSIKNRVLSAEKGFNLKDTRDLGYPQFIHEAIISQGWKQFCTHSPYANTTIVREFYAHITRKFQDFVYVRGKCVNIESHSINACFGINVEGDEHSDFVASATVETLKSVVQDLCVEGAEWTTTRQGTRTFFRCDLKPEAKVWYHFLKASLMPTLHLQTVSEERALVLHSILKGRKMDIGSIIHHELLACAQKKKSRLFFPCLITKLCEYYGVSSQDDDEKLLNKGAITSHAISRIMQESDQDQPEAGEEEAEYDRQATSSAPRSSHSESALKQLEQRMSLFETEQYYMAEEFRSFRREQKEFWAYTEARDKAEQKNIKANSKKFFTYPEFPSHILRRSGSEASDT